MNIENTHVYGAVLAGVGATVIMDLWALFLRHGFKIAQPNYCLVGRWVTYMPAGVFRHANIAATPKRTAECTVGWIVHYLVGVAYAFVLVIPTSGHWLEHPSLLPALMVGIGTVVIPYFVMQPSFGLGIAAAKTPSPIQARLRSLMSHTAYGVGLYVAALGVSHVLS